MCKNAILLQYFTTPFSCKAAIITIIVVVGVSMVIGALKWMHKCIKEAIQDEIDQYNSDRY